MLGINNNHIAESITLMGKNDVLTTSHPDDSDNIPKDKLYIIQKELDKSISINITLCQKVYYSIILLNEKAQAKS